ncbi:MAG: hypothetical protein AAFO04_04250 [Cyanobacteria bacterium J06592_8]
MASEFSFGAVFRFLLTAIFFGINLLFTVHFYALMIRDFRRLARAQHEMKRVTSTF